MRIRSRVSVTAVAVGLVLGGTIPAGPAAVAAPAGPPVPSIAWQPCGAEFPGLECADAAVPLDYDLPGGPSIRIALARKPATNTAERIGSIFLNPGGPGGSGVDLVLSGFGEALSTQLGGRFDIVGFDPRGIGLSAPLHCFDSVEDLNAFLGSGPAFPYQRAQERPYFDQLRSLGQECRDDDGPITRHMSTADVARDLDLLRRAVGDRKLTYLGFSYGSFLGNTYANLFGDNIRAMVIDGVLDPQLWSSGWQIRSDRVATAQEFAEFLRLCDEAGPDCAFAAPEGSTARWEALADALRANPLDLGDGTVYSYDMLINDVVGAMYVPESWGGPEGAGALLDQLADAVLGSDGAAVARVPALRQALHDRLRPASREADYQNFFDAYNGNVCADIEFPTSFGSYRAIGQFAEAGSRFGPFWWWTNSACADWPVNSDRFTGPWRARTSAPVLVVGNHFDGVTDFAGAQASARLLEGSRLLAYAGWGHTAYGRSACATEHIDQYLLTGALPPRGTVCPANPNPFLPTVARSASVLVGLPAIPPAR